MCVWFGKQNFTLWSFAFLRRQVKLKDTIAITALTTIDLENVILDKDLSAAIKYNHKTNLVEFLQKTAKYD